MNINAKKSAQKEQRHSAGRSMADEVKKEENKNNNPSESMMTYFKSELREFLEEVPFKDRLAKANFPQYGFVTFFVDLRRPFLKWSIWRKTRSVGYVLLPIYYNKQWCAFWLRDDSSFYRDMIIDVIKKNRTVFTVEIYQEGDEIKWALEDNPEDKDLKSFIPDYFP